MVVVVVVVDELIANERLGVMVIDDLAGGRITGSSSDVSESSSSIRSSMS